MRTVFSKEPRNLGTFDINCKEMMFVQDMPIALPGSPLRIPQHLECFAHLVMAVAPCFTERDYIYLSAKRMFVSPDSNYNRPGWHIDGYGTSDRNYIWYDSCPTEFCVNQAFYLSDDHTESMKQMALQACVNCIKTYPAGSLLRLDNTIVHRVAKVTEPRMRTFVKISVSRNRYNREGNAHNYLFDYD